MNLTIHNKKATYPKWVLVAMILMLISGLSKGQNLLTNAGFETAGGSGWTEGGTTGKFDVTGAGEFKSGARARGFWMDNVADGTLSQTISNATAGTYTASVWTRRGTTFEYARLVVKNGSTILASANLPAGDTYAQTTLSSISVPGGANLIFQVEFKSTSSNYITVDDASLTVTASSSVAIPTFSPGAGTYTSAQSVTISTTTSGATIYYTTDGSTPTTSSNVYSSSINVGSTQTIKALATKSGMTNSSTGTAAYTINISGGGSAGTGNITREYWAGISGTSISSLTGNANYPNSPTSTSLLTSFESPSSVADNYGQRVKGYVTAPSTGSYTFWIAADDDAELWLSTDGSSSNKVKIASVSGWTASQEWTKYSSQTSASINLTAGTQYYIEALHKEGSGGDNLAVAWQVPGGSRVVIPGSALSTTLVGGGGSSTAATPTFNLAGGTYTSTQSVTLSTTTSGAAIRYTTDGSTPTSSSTLYSSPISVASSQTIKAIAIASGMTNSSIGSAVYTINTGSTGTYYVSTSGTDSPGNGTSGAPWRTVSYAASQVPGGMGYTISVASGTYYENSPIMLQPKVNLTGAGQSSTIITKSGSFDVSNTDFNVPIGTLIQLVSSPLPSAPVDGGGQTLSNFKVDGSGRTVKAGVWVQNRTNVTMTNVTITNTNFRGAAFSPGYKDWFIEPAYYLTGININNCTFTNTSKDVPANSQSLGALCISGLDGANIYNITINEDQGYGIKFIYDGYFKNTQIHDCTISVPETDSQWGEDASIEFWNAGTNNSIYNITCNTWLSLVNHASGPFGSATSVGQRLKVYGIKMIDGNASSGKESIEAAVPGLEIYDSYFQNKGFGIGIWDDGGKYTTVRNCTFYNSAAQNAWASGAIYIDNSTGTGFNNINIYNNIFDAQNNAVNIKNTGAGITNVNIKNNAFLTGTGSDVVTSGSVSNVVFTNNLNGKGYWTVTGVTTNSNNVAGDPQYQWSGNRYDNTFYAPSSSSSFAVAKGANVGLAYSGTAPDIGRYEWTGGGGRQIASDVEQQQSADNIISSYPNPTTGIVRISSTSDVKIEGVQVFNPQGKTILNRSVNQLNGVDIDLSQQPNDIYIFKIKHQKGMITKKVVLMK